MRYYKMHKTLIAALLLILFAASAAATPNAYALHQLNSTHWYFESTQNDLPEGTHNYTAYANNKSTEYQILVYDITPPASITPLTTTTGNFYHNWTWTNPADADFNHTTIYINGSWITVLGVQGAAQASLFRAGIARPRLSRRANAYIL